MVEIWKDIEGYCGCYQVSNFGNVKSLNYMHTGREKILKVEKTKCGYLRVIFCKDGKIKRFSVHRLVAQAFIPNPYNLPQVNHIDENKTNNIVSNLQWCSSQYNINYGHRNEKISKKVLCVETGKVYTSTHQVERELGFANSNISRACNGKQKSAYGFHWRYI